MPLRDAAHACWEGVASTGVEASDAWTAWLRTAATVRGVCHDSSSNASYALVNSTVFFLRVFLGGDLSGRLLTPMAYKYWENTVFLNESWKILASLFETFIWHGTVSVLVMVECLVFSNGTHLVDHGCWAAFVACWRSHWVYHHRTSFLSVYS